MFGEDFLNSLQETVEDTAGSIASSAGSWFADHVSDLLVREGDAPKGNLSAAEIAAGQRGAPPQPSLLSRAGAMFSGPNALPMLAVGVIGAFLIFRRR